jgi:hypothetical protein
VKHGCPASRLEVMEHVFDRVPDCSFGILRSGHPILWRGQTYLIPADDFFCVHTKKFMHGPFYFSDGTEVSEGLKIFFKGAAR